MSTDKPSLLRQAVEANQIRQAIVTGASSHSKPVMLADDTVLLFRGDDVRLLERTVKQLQALIDKARVQSPQVRALHHDVRLIQSITAEHFDVTPEAMLSRSRWPVVMWPRHVAIALACELTDYGTSALGDMFGGLTRSTVNWARNGVQDRIETETKTKREFEAVRAKVVEALAIARNGGAESTEGKI